ncbi:MAG: hypothetical protein RLZZ236_2045 [Bacteroidota bacterium]|jgi:predicted nucleic acid-binding protein
MAQIEKLSEKLPESFSHYFFDSNVWIAFLKYNRKNNADRRFTPYIDFFEGVVQLNEITDPKLQRKVKHIPKIVMTSMLLSEIINTYLRVVAMPSFLNKPNSDFKKEYRNNIHKQLKILLDDLKSYSFIYEYVKDDFNELNPMELLSDLNRKVDFNDLYYMKLMEKYQYVIVTDDGDFDSHEITVLTENKNLLSKQ